jgi:signal transduction histidine kinase
VDEIKSAVRTSPTAQLCSLSELIDEMEAAAKLTAAAHGCSLFVSVVYPDLAVNVDRDLLTGALGNLLNNAFKFTQPGTQVSLEAYAAAERILIDVKDQCGGLPPGTAERIFMPFVQVGTDRSGLGFGLSIAKHSVELFGGTIQVQDAPGVGCTFTVNLPRYSMTPR